MPGERRQRTEPDGNTLFSELTKAVFRVLITNGGENSYRRPALTRLRIILIRRTRPRFLPFG